MWRVFNDAQYIMLHLFSIEFGSMFLQSQMKNQSTTNEQVIIDAKNHGDHAYCGSCNIVRLLKQDALLLHVPWQCFTRLHS